jgi:hypothetical protein
MDKKHIISEIIRTAKENSGIPLGQIRFHDETGIKKHDWYGKYWARWSDALIEAGFKPNPFGKGETYDEDFLLFKLAEFTKKIGHFPSDGDLQLQSHNDKSFPYSQTFNRRLGNKTNKVKLLHRFCKNKEEYLSVLKICEKIMTDTSQSGEADISIDSDFGYVYLMKFKNYYKIGKSINVERRNYEIGIKLPEKFEIVHKIKTDDPAGIESYWHNRFKDKRKQGEWFDLSPTDITAFKRRKFM